MKFSGVKKIAIVDDLEENRQAGLEAIKHTFPSVKVILFSSAAEISAILGQENTPDVDLVFTDMDMEEEFLGFQVAQQALAWQIPCIPVSGGFQTHSTDQVIVGGFENHRAGEAEMILGSKASTHTWKQIIQRVTTGDRRSNHVLKMLHYGKFTAPDYEYGETCAGVVCGSIFTQRGRKRT